MTDADTQTLHCPTCGYNLTGLPENRCPECGLTFSPEALRLQAQAGPNRIGMEAMLYHVLSAPLVSWIWNLGVRIRIDAPDWVMVVVIPTLVTWAVINSGNWARRATDAQFRREGKRSTGTFAFCFLSALLFQAILGGCPCLIMV